MKQRHELPKFIKVELPPEVYPAVHWYHRRHWRRNQRDEATFRLAAYDFCALAFAIPAQISEVADSLCDLRDAEGITTQQALTKLIQGHNDVFRKWGFWVLKSPLKPSNL